MKRTWVVYVGEGVGHELHNCISESDFYGPYTFEQAEKLEDDLNARFLLLWPDNKERLLAQAMPLVDLPPSKVMKLYDEAD